MFESERERKSCVTIVKANIVYRKKVFFLIVNLPSTSENAQPLYIPTR